MGQLTDALKSPVDSHFEDRLSSWKEVAVYLGVSVRTVQRWEKKEDLPVNRHLHESRSTVYAFRSELDAWLAKRYPSIEYSSVALKPEGVLPSAGVDYKSTSPAISINPSIAILPFVNFSSSKDDAFLCDALVEELINRLTRIPGLHVTARTSSFAFRGKETDVREIGDKLNVKTILEGSLARAGNRIKINAQLVEASEGYYIWSVSYDRELKDIFAIQDEVCRMIADKLRVRLTNGWKSRANRHSEDLDAYTMFIQGSSHLGHFDPEGVERSKECFDRALEIDPEYALAHVGIGMSHWIRGFLNLAEPQDTFSACDSALKKAFELDNSIAEAHALQGCIHVMRDFNWEGARDSFQQALELDPGSTESQDLYDFFFLLPRGNLEIPFEHAKQAISRNPLSAWLYFRLGYRLFLHRDFERAEASVRKSLELDPNCYSSYWVRAHILCQKGEYDEAVRSSEMLCSHTSRGPWGFGLLGYSYAKSGQISETRKILKKLQAISKSRYLPPSSFAPLYFGLGDNDSGFECLHRSIEERDFSLIHLAIDPFWDFIRADPRYSGLLQKMKL